MEKACTPSIVNMIQGGLLPNFVLPVRLSADPALSLYDHNSDEFRSTLAVFADYLKVGAVSNFALHDVRVFIPWFVISKFDHASNQVKRRCISNCRKINHFMETKHFRLDHSGVVFPHLRCHQWAAKIDFAQLLSKTETTKMTRYCRHALLSMESFGEHTCHTQNEMTCQHGKE